MPPRRERSYEETLGRNKMIVRWEIEREVVRFAVTLLARVNGAWRTVVVFDCSHGDRNDRHRYSYDGVKGAAVTFHHGTPSEAMNDAINLIRADYERIIERWRR
ncbi:MAG: hypothetical protein ACJ76L_07500 [Conexibacter sp.]